MAGSPQKISFRTFDGTKLCGYYYPVAEAKAPVVILTAGLTFLKEHFIDAFAVEFQKVGIAAICYDHRNWGESGGTPRNHTVFPQQIEDYHSAITYALSLGSAIDKNRVCIWGAGHAGGVVMPVAALDARVKCVVTMVPFISGSEDAKYWPSGYLERAHQERAKVIADDLDWKAKPGYVPIFASPKNWEGPPAVIGSSEAWDFYQQCKKRSDAVESAWPNEITLQSLWWGSRWEPTHGIEKIGQKPLLYVVAEFDKFIPIAAQRKVFDQVIGPKELITLPCEHLDTYMGKSFEENAAKQIAWLKEWL